MISDCVGVSHLRDSCARCNFVSVTPTSAGIREIIMKDNTPQRDITPKDLADLDATNKPDKVQPVRGIVREIHAFSHPDEPDMDGARETWIKGFLPNSPAGEEVLLRLDSGAGLGNAKLSLVIEADGQRIGWEYIDMTTLVESWAASIVDDYMSGNTAEADRIADALEALRAPDEGVTS